MIFSSPRFFVFLFVVLALLGQRFATKTKLSVLALASCLFYAAWDWRYLGLLIFISVVDYVCAARIQGSASAIQRKLWLGMSIVSNLGVLAYFKYVNFFIDNFNLVGSRFYLHLDMMKVLLPAGISFYTFKTMSYTIDVYRRHLEPARSWMAYVTFITFFPELIAGPIVRASVFLPQMGRPIGPTARRLSVGFSVFLLGLTKKAVMADRLSTIADPIFADPRVFDAATLWCGLLAYTIQIYCDFSGYSDMAIGVA